MAKKKKRITDEEVTATTADFTDSNFMLMDGGEGSKKVPMDLFAVQGHEYLIMHSWPHTGNVVGYGETKLAFESEEATEFLIKTGNFEIDRENSRITGFDPKRFYLVQANLFYSAHAMSAMGNAPQRIQVSATQTSPTNYYAMVAPVIVDSTGFIPLSFIVTGRTFIEFYGNLMDGVPIGGRADYLYFYDVQIMELAR